MATHPEHVTVYLGKDGKWRWTRRRGSRTVSASTQGYSSKQWVLYNLKFSMQGADYTVEFQTKKDTPNGRLFQRGLLHPLSGPPIPVTVYSWNPEEVGEWTP